MVSLYTNTTKAQRDLGMQMHEDGLTSKSYNHASVGDDISRASVSPQAAAVAGEDVYDGLFTLQHRVGTLSCNMLSTS